MITKIILNIKSIFDNLDRKAFSILKYGLHFCLYLALFSILILFTYEVLYKLPFVYDFGLFLFRLSLIFSIEFIICSIAMDRIKKQMI